MKLFFCHEFTFYTSSMYEICLHCHWLGFSSITLNFGQCELPQSQFFGVFRQYSTKLSIVNRNVHDSRLLHFCTRSEFFLRIFNRQNQLWCIGAYMYHDFSTHISRSSSSKKLSNNSALWMVKYVFSFLFTYLWTLGIRPEIISRNFHTLARKILSCPIYWGA